MKFILLAAVVLLSSCASAPSVSIDQELKAKGFSDTQIDQMWEHGDATGDYSDIDAA